MVIILLPTRNDATANGEIRYGEQATPNYATANWDSTNQAFVYSFAKLNYDKLKTARCNDENCSDSTFLSFLQRFQGNNLIHYQFSYRAVPLFVGS